MQCSDLLPIPIRADIARRRAVKLLMSVSLPRQDVAVALEQNAYKIFVMSSSTYTAAPSESVLVTHKYTACITRLAFALLVKYIYKLFIIFNLFNGIVLYSSYTFLLGA